MTPDDLRREIANLIATRRETPLAAATGSLFVAAGHEQEQGQERQRQQPEQQQHRPLIILRGLPEPFLSALMESPLNIDPAFIRAHAERRRYRPRGGGGGGGGPVPAHWDYPELVDGRGPALRPVGNVGRDLAAAAVFCRAGVWPAEGVDVLFLDGHVSARLAPAHSNSTLRGVVRAEGSGPGGWEGTRGWQVVHEKGRGVYGLEAVVQEAMSEAGAVGGHHLGSVIEEAAYDHWLDFFDVLVPRRETTAPGETSLEWRVMQALERNTDTSKDIARRGRKEKKSPDAGPPAPNWESLTRRLRLRVEMLASMPPIPRPRPRPSSRSKVLIHEDNLVPLPALRQPMSPATDKNGGSYPWSPDTDEDENQRSLDRVTYLGGMLLPFSIVSGIFSMNENFGPGRPFFWVFWVVAVPFAVFAILVIYADKLRRVEVWVPDHEAGSLAGEKDDGEGSERREEEKRVSWDQSMRPELRAWRPEGRMYSAQPEVVNYTATEDVVIDLGTPTTITTTIGPPPPPPPIFTSPPLSSLRPDNDQSHAEQQIGEEEGEYSSEEEGEASSVAEEAGPNMDPDGSHHQRLPIKRLGWGGAVLYILGLRRPLTVPEARADGAIRGYRRRSRR